MSCNFHLLILSERSYFSLSSEESHLEPLARNSTWAQTQNLRHILFNSSRQCFYPSESSAESLSESPQGLEYCLGVLKKSCSGALC